MRDVHRELFGATAHASTPHMTHKTADNAGFNASMTNIAHKELAIVGTVLCVMENVPVGMTLTIAENAVLHVPPMRVYVNGTLVIHASWTTLKNAAISVSIHEMTPKTAAPAGTPAFLAASAFPVFAYMASLKTPTAKPIPVSKSS